MGYIIRTMVCTEKNEWQLQNVKRRKSINTDIGYKGMNGKEDWRGRMATCWSFQYDGYLQACPCSQNKLHQEGLLLLVIAC